MSRSNGGFSLLKKVLALESPEPLQEWNTNSLNSVASYIKFRKQVASSPLLQLLAVVCSAETIQWKCIWAGLKLDQLFVAWQGKWKHTLYHVPRQAFRRHSDSFNTSFSHYRDEGVVNIRVNLVSKGLTYPAAGFWYSSTLDWQFLMSCCTAGQFETLEYKQAVTHNRKCSCLHTTLSASRVSISLNKLFRPGSMYVVSNSVEMTGRQSRKTRN